MHYGAEVTESSTNKQNHLSVTVQTKVHFRFPIGFPETQSHVRETELYSLLSISEIFSDPSLLDPVKFSGLEIFIS
jgi:hypothetical protein